MDNLFHKSRTIVNKKIRLVLIILSLLIITYFGYKGFVGINSWFDRHYFQFNQMVEIKLNKPVEVKEREIQITQVFQILDDAQLPRDLTPIEEYICEKFGQYECKLAIAIFKHEGMHYDENGELVPDKVYVEEDKTISVGVAQINQVNWKLEGCALKEIVDPYKNVDCAYRIWDRCDGEEGNGKGCWNAWGAYNNGNFKQNL